MSKLINLLESRDKIEAFINSLDKQILLQIDITKRAIIRDQNINHGWTKAGLICKFCKVGKCHLHLSQRPANNEINLLTYLQEKHTSNIKKLEKFKIAILDQESVDLLTNIRNKESKFGITAKNTICKKCEISGKRCHLHLL